MGPNSCPRSSFWGARCNCWCQNTPVNSFFIRYLTNWRLPANKQQQKAIKESPIIFFNILLQIVFLKWIKYWKQNNNSAEPLIYETTNGKHIWTISWIKITARSETNVHLSTITSYTRVPQSLPLTTNTLEHPNPQSSALATNAPRQNVQVIAAGKVFCKNNHYNNSNPQDAEEPQSNTKYFSEGISEV